MPPFCISYIPHESGSARVEIGICELYSHHNGDRLYRELLEEIGEYIAQDLLTGVVATGLTR